MTGMFSDGTFCMVTLFLPAPGFWKPTSGPDFWLNIFGINLKGLVVSVHRLYKTKRQPVSVRDEGNHRDLLFQYPVFD